MYKSIHKAQLLLHAVSNSSVSLLPSRPALRDCYKNSLMAQRLVLLPRSTTVLGLGLETWPVVWRLLVLAFPFVSFHISHMVVCHYGYSSWWWALTDSSSYLGGVQCREKLSIRDWCSTTPSKAVWVNFLIPVFDCAHVVADMNRAKLIKSQTKSTK